MVTNQERLAVIETKVETIQQDIKEVKNILKTHVEWEDKKYDSLREDFASKWVEKFAIATLSGATVAVIAGLIYIL